VFCVETARAVYEERDGALPAFLRGHDLSELQPHSDDERARERFARARVRWFPWSATTRTLARVAGARWSRRSSRTQALRTFRRRTAARRDRACVSQQSESVAGG